eukprot:gene2566-2868_t
MSSEEGMPFIGSQISLISKSGIRYEGILHTINMEESSIALQSVRSFGTEGRRADGPQVPPSNETYEFIIFRGEDIQDLTVMHDQPPAQPPAPSVPDDPAIISAGASTTTPLYGAGYGAPSGPSPVYGGGGLWGPPGAPPPPAATQQQPPGQYGGPYGGPPGGPLAPNVAPTVNLTPVAQQHQPPAGTANGDIGLGGSYAHAAGGPGRGGGYGAGGPTRGVMGGPPGRGGGMAGPPPGRGGMGPVGGGMPGRGLMPPGPAGGRGPPGPIGGRGMGRGPVPAPAPAPAPPVPDEDYNFEEANKHFNKEAALREAQEAVKTQHSAYNKDDFFDMVSCEALDKMQSMEGPSGHHRRNMHEQRAVDIETFGGLGGMRHLHHRGRGRRGGGRGPTEDEDGGFCLDMGHAGKALADAA